MIPFYKNKQTPFCRLVRSNKTISQWTNSFNLPPQQDWCSTLSGPPRKLVWLLFFRPSLNNPTVTNSFSPLLPHLIPPVASCSFTVKAINPGKANIKLRKCIQERTVKCNNVGFLPCCSFHPHQLGGEAPSSLNNIKLVVRALDAPLFSLLPRMLAKRGLRRAPTKTKNRMLSFFTPNDALNLLLLQESFRVTLHLLEITRRRPEST